MAKAKKKSPTPAKKKAAKKSPTPAKKKAAKKLPTPAKVEDRKWKPWEALHHLSGGLCHLAKQLHEGDPNATVADLR